MLIGISKEPDRKIIKKWEDKQGYPIHYNNNKEGNPYMYIFYYIYKNKQYFNNFQLPIDAEFAIANRTCGSFKCFLVKSNV